MNIRSAIVEESTLSFIGIGLPLEVISWGSMLSLSEKSTAYRCLVDYLDSRCFSCCDTIVHYQHWRLYQKKLNKQESNL